MHQYVSILRMYTYMYSVHVHVPKYTAVMYTCTCYRVQEACDCSFLYWHKVSQYAYASVASGQSTGLEQQ